MPLCFGTFAKAYKAAKKPKKTNVATVELLLSLVTSNREIKQKNDEVFCVTDKIASQYINCKEPIHGDIVAAVYDDDIVEASELFFEDVAIPELDDQLTDRFILDIGKLIEGDSNIPATQKAEWLSNAGKGTLPAFLAPVFIYALKQNNVISILVEAAKSDLLISQAIKDMDYLEELIKKYPHPEELPVPDIPEDEELKYIMELLAVYAEELKAEELIQIEDLKNYPDFQEDLLRHRKNYYAAESIREGTKNCFGDKEETNFKTLKEEVFDNVYFEYMKRHASAMDKLIGVMNQAALSPVTRSRLLSKLDWISAREKQGVCHFIVKDGKMKWVKRNG